MINGTTLLQSFAEPVVFKDLEHCVVSHTQGLSLHAPLRLCQQFRVHPEQGATFVAVTDDPNGIHTEGDIVPGAYMWAKVLFGLEVLLPRLEVVEMKTRFSAITHYGEALLSELSCLPRTDGHVGIEVKIYRDGEVVSSSVIHGRLSETSSTPVVARRRVNSEELQRVYAFSNALGIDPDAYFYQNPDAPDFTYPCSFMASLPSGALVRSLQGDGGVLGALKLSFLARKKRAIVGPGPEVTVQRPKRWRKTFNRILTAIQEGVVTYLQGSALVGRVPG